MFNFSVYKLAVKDFLSHARNDWRKIVWPEKHTVFALYILAIISCIIFAVIFMYIDMFISKIIKVLLTFGNK